MRFIDRYLKCSRPEDVSITDLRKFLGQGVEEHQTLEYKPRGMLVLKDDSIIRPRDPNDLSGFVSLAKSVAAFANAEGGLLILGVKEKAERIRGSIVKVRPGPLAPLPPTVTREVVENQLLGLIQHPIEGVVVVPVRITRSKTVYLIDVPQSNLAPHRVAERWYFQRYNFSNLEMKHYQIADLFGRRRLSKLLLRAEPGGKGSSTSGGVVRFRGKVLLSLENVGRGTAKSPFLSFVVSPGTFVVSDFGADGRGYEGLPRVKSEWRDKNNKYGGTTAVVIHPSVQHPVTALEFEVPIDATKTPDLTIRYSVASEDEPLEHGRLEFSGRELAEAAIRAAGHTPAWAATSSSQPAG